jgi:hypothetical protein
MHKCPLCHKAIEVYFEVHTDKPFTAHEPMEGLIAWGGIDVPRTILCQNDAFVHFAFDFNGQEHLVKMIGFNLEATAAAKDKNAKNPETCGHEGCTNEGTPCYLMPLDEEAVGYYCWEHAHDEGFCPSCGHFFAGWESFDFSPDGLCEGCREMYRDEMEDYDEYEDDYD